MAIQPTRPGETPRSGAERLSETAARPPVAGERNAETPPAAGSAADHVQLSQEVRELLARRGLDEVPVGEVPAERLRQVMERLHSGYYDRPEVRDEVLAQLARDLSDDGPA